MPTPLSSQRSWSSGSVRRSVRCDVAALLAPARHATGEVSRDVGDADGGGERHGLTRVCVVAADDEHRLVEVGQPRQLGPEAGAQRGDADRAGDVGLVELQLGADVDDERALVLLGGDLSRRQADAARCCRARSGPRLIATMFSKFGGWGPSDEVVSRTNSSSSVMPSSS